MEDEDNATLDLVTDVNNYFYSNTNEQPVIDDLDSENAGDSDSDSGSTVSDSGDGVVFERSEDIALTESLSEFFRTGCGCHLMKGNDLLLNVIISFFWKQPRNLLTLLWVACCNICNSSTAFVIVSKQKIMIKTKNI